MSASGLRIIRYACPTVRGRGEHVHLNPFRRGELSVSSSFPCKRWRLIGDTRESLCVVEKPLHGLRAALFVPIRWMVGLTREWVDGALPFHL